MTFYSQSQPSPFLLTEKESIQAHVSRGREGQRGRREKLKHVRHQAPSHDPETVT